MRTGRQPALTTMASLPADEVGDAELVRRAQRHATEFGPLYLRYRDRVLRYCLYRLGDLAEAEDATSTVFIHALHGITSVHDDDSSFRPWLFRIAHNEVVDRYKRRAFRPEPASCRVIVPSRGTRLRGRYRPEAPGTDCPTPRLAVTAGGTAPLWREALSSSAVVDSSPGQAIRCPTTRQCGFGTVLFRPQVFQLRLERGAAHAAHRRPA